MNGHEWSIKRNKKYHVSQNVARRFFSLQTTETKGFQLKNDVHGDVKKPLEHNEAEPTNFVEDFNQPNGITMCEAHQ